MAPKTKTKMNGGAIIPLRAERQRIAAHASCDERSVKRAYEAKAIRSTTRERIVAAAIALAVPPPPLSNE